MRRRRDPGRAVPRRADATSDWNRIVAALHRLEAAGIIPVTRLRVLNTGHFVHRDQPSEYLAELRSFFDGHPMDG
ncbi:hypothetical protein Pen01_16900 [Phytomonospora endophytica]|nr:hypothetical protein Pen01_16900 [Phytomonospora endophytica]